nr:molecular chaperone [uncultured Agathobacter sp.]
MNASEKKMDNNRQEQIEALDVLKGFNEKLLKNMKIIVKELSGARLEDTDKFLNAIIDAMNWEIQVVNGTMSLLNQGENRIDKTEFNNVIIELNSAIESKCDEEMAQKFEAAIPMFEKLQKATIIVLNMEK